MAYVLRKIVELYIYFNEEVSGEFESICAMWSMCYVFSDMWVCIFRSKGLSLAHDEESLHYDRGSSTVPSVGAEVGTTLHGEATTIQS